MEPRGMDKAVELLQGLAASGDEVARRELSLTPLAASGAPARVVAVDGGSRLLYDLPGVIIGAFRVCAATIESGRMSDSRGDITIVAIRKGDEAGGSAGEDESGDSRDGPGAGEEPATTAISLRRSAGEWSRTLEALRAAGEGDVILVDGCLDPPEASCAALAEEALGLASSRGVALVGISKRSELAVGGLPALPLAAWHGRRAMPNAAWTCPLPGQSGSFSTFAVKFSPSARHAFRADVASASPLETLASLSALCDDAGYPGYPYPLARAHNLAAMDQALCDDLRFQVDEAVRRRPGGAFWDVLKDDFHSVLDRGVR